MVHLIEGQTLIDHINEKEPLPLAGRPADLERAVSFAHIRRFVRDNIRQLPCSFHIANDAGLLRVEFSGICRRDGRSKSTGLAM